MLKFLKIRNVKNPEREKGNAGIDLFIPTDIKPIILKPLERVTIPSGLKVRIELSEALSLFNLGIDLLVENKSGVSTKKGLLVTACEIDENYTGEIHIGVVNVSNNDVTIYPNEKIVQVVPRVYINEQIQITENEKDFYKGFTWTNRGDNGFGSTNE